MNDSELFKMRKIIKLSLMKIGIRCDLIGFTYLAYAIELVVLQPDLLNSLCKDLYVNVGKKFSVAKSTSVERSIRHAIDTIYDNESFLVLNKIFNAPIYSEDEKPTAGGLIKLMMEYYYLGLYKDFLKCYE